MADSEFDLINRYFTGIGRGSQVLRAIGDDTAALQIPDGAVLQVSTDTSLPGVHFLADTLPEDIAYRAVAVAASDLAAVGATPTAMLLSLTLPEADALWLSSVSQGLLVAAEEFQMPLVGGDTTRGSLSLAVTVFGYTQGLGVTRTGAQVGDRVCVSGVLGEARAGLALLSGEPALNDLGDDAIDHLTVRYTRPKPRLALGQMLLGRATAAIDLSDGLLGDAEHIATASRVQLWIDVERLPLSPACVVGWGLQQAREWGAVGGDDYELLFCLPKSEELPPGCTEIGEVREGRGVMTSLPITGGSYDHFAE
jgi:thiamine-monophosphate kinase